MHLPYHEASEQATLDRLSRDFEASPECEAYAENRLFRALGCKITLSP